MHVAFRSFATPLGVTVAIVALACGRGDADRDPAPIDPAPSGASEPRPPANGENRDGPAARPRSGLSVSVGGYPLDVDNPMSHAMLVRVALPGGGEIELGPVPARGQRAFQLPVRAGDTITLIARDHPETHRATASIALPDGGTGWTIE